MKGGIKTIVWTDTLQTTFMLLAVVISDWFNPPAHGCTGLGEYDLVQVWNSDLSKIVETDITDSPEVLPVKMFVSGMFITIVMTGLRPGYDAKKPELQKSRKTLRKNMTTLSLVLGPC